MASRYEAVLFDLLSGLIDSWSLWDRIAGGPERGRHWRMCYLERTYATGRYRSYVAILEEAAEEADLPASCTRELIDHWTELEAWPEAAGVLRTLSQEVPIGVVTNCSKALATAAASRVGADFSVVVSAEQAGWYKPHPRPYRVALEELDVAPAQALYVAGSPYDLEGAAGVGMPVFWHNRPGLPRDNDVQVVREADSLRPLLELVLQ